MTAFPSLKGLQAFEAAARTGSFTAAASELCVSPAAISQLIRALEEQIERKLFHRIKRGIAPTEAGLEIFPHLNAAFDELKGVSRQLAGASPRSRLTISVPPSVATGWLSTQIDEFVTSHGPFDISLRGENDPVAFERDLIDIRMSYGRFHYRTHETEEIVTDAAFAVCSPGFLARYGPFDSVEALLNAPLIHTDWGPAAATFPAWRDWFEAASIAPGRYADHGFVANSSIVAIDLAISGLGVALNQGLLAARPIEAGLLVLPFAQALALSQPYYLTIPQRSAKRHIVSTFKDWFIQVCLRCVKSPALTPGPGVLLSEKGL